MRRTKRDAAKSVIFFQYPWRFWRERLSGIYRYAEKVGWQVQVLEYGRTVLSARKALAFWRPDGCIVEGGYTELRGFRQSDFDGVPTVFCDANRTKMTGPYSGVVHDSVVTTTLAVSELLRLGFADYGYVAHLQPREWSDRREQVMRRLLAREGRTFHSFAPGSPGALEAVFSRLRAWLRQLPKPCGVLGANDMMADLILQACRQESLQVPDEIAVCGIDNDEFLCRHARPTLTSVVPDFERGGYLAARLLDTCMRRPKASPSLVRFEASHVVRRNSTAKFARRDDSVRDALAFIRERACAPLSSAEVCARIGGSRRQAECRFRKLVGHSIGEEIRSVRIARAKDLLLRRHIPIESIFADCGYTSDASLRRAFRKATGCSLRDWRTRAKS